MTFPLEGVTYSCVSPHNDTKRRDLGTTLDPKSLCWSLKVDLWWGLRVCRVCYKQLLGRISADIWGSFQQTSRVKGSRQNFEALETSALAQTSMTRKFGKFKRTPTKTSLKNLRAPRMKMRCFRPRGPESSPDLRPKNVPPDFLCHTVCCHEVFC